MGAQGSKIPLGNLKMCTIKDRKLKNSGLILSPRLCMSIFESTNGSCYDQEIKALKAFLSRPTNRRLFARKTFMQSETEVIKFLKIKHDKPLSPNAEQYLCKILQHLESSYRKPVLVSSIVMPRLEIALAQHKALVKQERRLYWLALAKNAYYFVVSLFRFKLSAKSLRKDPVGLKPIAGLDRAHKFSLFLAVELWKHVYGHQYVKIKDKELLREALAQDFNMYHTCPHVNRTLHVKYDNEIADAVSKGVKVQTPGAKMRIKQIQATFRDLEQHSPLMLDFCLKASRLLKKV